MALLSREDIIAVEDRTTETVKVPEWGGEVLVRSLSGRERDEFESSTVRTRGGKREENYDNFRARLVSLCLVDEDGRRLFTSKSDIILLGNKSVAALQRVFNKAQELNGMSDEDVEELTDSFEKTPGEDSASG